MRTQTRRRVNPEREKDWAERSRPAAGPDGRGGCGEGRFFYSKSAAMVFLILPGVDMMRPNSVIVRRGKLRAR